MAKSFTPQEITETTYIVCSSVEQRTTILEYLSNNGFSLSIFGVRIMHNDLTAEPDDLVYPVIAVLTTPTDFGWNVGIYSTAEEDGIVLSDIEFIDAYIYNTAPNYQDITPEEFEEDLMELLCE